MSFNIFVSGSSHFNYIKNDCFEENDLDIVKFLYDMQSPSVAGAIDYARDQVVPQKGVADLVTSMAYMELGAILSQSVDFLYMKSNDSSLISVYSIHSNFLWVDTNSYTEYRFPESDNPGLDFAKKICKSLKTNDMLSLGILRQLIAATAVYGQYLDSSGADSVRLCIQLNR